MPRPRAFPSLLLLSLCLSACLSPAAAQPPSETRAAQAFASSPPPSTALPAEPTPASNAAVTWIYALAAPFPTVTDGVTLTDLQAAWNASSSGPWAGSPLWMTESTRRAFTALWGEAGPGAVRTASSDELVEKMWKSQPSWGIVPFEALEPKLKVLAVDGQSPIHKDFDPQAYPLKIEVALTTSAPASNRDPSKLTTIILTGVTALVRATAYIMEMKGVTYPGRDIRDLLRQADITHIDSFIHYGLGNLFFDQMGDIPYYPGIRREFIDRYVIYDGQLISVEPLTMMLVDHARPRPMTPAERAAFLNEYFYYSGWSELIPTPTPPPTVTLTPMSLPKPFTTLPPTPIP